MLVPRSRLLALVAVALVPACAFAVVPGPAAGLGVALAGLVLTLAAVDAVRSLPLLDGFALRLPPVIRLVKGRAASLDLRLERGDCPATSIRLALALPTPIGTPRPEHTFVFPPGPAARLDWPVVPRERGSFILEAAFAETVSPLGLWGCRRRLPCTTEFRVQPDLAAGMRANAAFLTRGLTGAHTQRAVGKGRDFEKLRDYLPGDGFDEIHWKATAKRRHPVTKVFQVERTQEVYVLIDASRLSGRPVPASGTATPETAASNATDDRMDPAIPAAPEALLEHYITSALLLGATAERQGDLFGLVTFAENVLGFIRARNGGAHYNACREQLVRLAPRAVTPDFEELAAFLRVRLRRRALLLCLTSLEDPHAAEGFLRGIELLRRQHVCVVVQPHSPGTEPLFSDARVESAEDLHRALAGHLQWQGLRELQTVLQRRGVGFVSAPAAGLTGALITRYLDVKRRQIL